MKIEDNIVEDNIVEKNDINDEVKSEVSNIINNKKNINDIRESIDKNNYITTKTKTITRWLLPTLSVGVVTSVMRS